MGCNTGSTVVPGCLSYSGIVPHCFLDFLSYVIFEDYRPVIMETSSTWVYLMFPHNYVQVVHFSGQNFTEVLVCYFPCVQSCGIWCQFFSLLVMFTLITWMRWCLWGFFTVKVWIFWHFGISNYFAGGNFWDCKILFLSSHSSVRFSINYYLLPD